MAFRRAPAVLTALAVLILASGQAAALRFDPMRVVLNDRKRTATVRIVNPDDVPRSYTVRWQRVEMTHDKGLEPIPFDHPIDGVKPLRDFTLFAPRQATVPPGQSQVLRFMVRPPEDLRKGEYRSHIAITEEPRTFGGSGTGTGQNDNQSVQIQKIVKTTFPVIFRHGKLDLSVSIEDTKIIRKNGKPVLRVTLERGGDRSLYGDVRIAWKGPDGGKLKLNEIRGVAIYTELNKRTFTHRLRLPPNRDNLPSGRVVYTIREHTDPTNDRRAGVLARTEIPVP